MTKLNFIECLKFYNMKQDFKKSFFTSVTMVIGWGEEVQPINITKLGWGLKLERSLF